MRPDRVSWWGDEDVVMEEGAMTLDDLRREEREGAREMTAEIAFEEGAIELWGCDGASPTLWLSVVE